jgi:formylglycine-generating enzyme required for sulfatase activity
MNQLLRALTLCPLITCVSIASCRTSGGATTKDVGMSPEDVNKPFEVVYLTPADSKVHLAECPSSSALVNRNCQGLTELSQIEKSEYESALLKEILSNRGYSSQALLNLRMFKTIEEKIARINERLSAGGLSDAEKNSLQAQLVDLNRQSADLNRQIQADNAPTVNDWKRYDFIMQNLNASNDITIDEGEFNYELAVFPFGPRYMRILPMNFVRIPAGTFMMGSPDFESGHATDEGPQHYVTLTKSFEMQTTEVTQAQWASVMGFNPSHEKEKVDCEPTHKMVGNVSTCANFPVEHVEWSDVQLFIQKLNAKADGFQYRLPTEAEWEYSARAGTTGAFAGDVDAMADCNFMWYRKNVGRMKPNAWGLYGMHDSAAELTSDWYGPYSSSAATDPLGPTAGTNRVYRGGCSLLTEGIGARSAKRMAFPRDSFRSGFRLIRVKI